VFKDKLFSLIPKINRALTDAEERKEKNITAEKLKTQAEELIIANKELLFQNLEKEKRAADLVMLSEALINQKEELKNANAELHEKALLLQQQEDKLIRMNSDLLLLNQHLEKRVLDRTSELEKINHQLKDLSLSKDKFLSVISHDLRNPLTALLIASDQLSNDIKERVFDDIQPYADSIHRSSQNILQQLNELVDWAKRQKEKTSFNPEKLKLYFAVDQSFELLKTTARQKNIILENNVPDDIYVMADFLMLRSILQNLVTNAIKFSKEGGLVKVFSLRINKMVEVCVDDAGIGMELAVHENLFKQSGSSTESGTNNEKGLGLGLILVKDFVAQHDGSLRVESKIKKGTSIFFTIPVGD
jgi:signal transduction histidine kinase